MNRITMWTGLMLASMALTACGGGDAAPAEPGAESPKAAMKQLAQAVDNDNPAALAAMMPAENDAQKATNQKMAKMLLNMKRMPKIMEQAHEKFGKEKVSEALGFGAIMLAGMSPPDFEEIAAEGEFLEEGDKATYVVEQKQGAMTTKQKVDLVKKDGRWYADLGKAPGGQDVDQAVDGLTDMIEGLDQAVKNSADAQSFAKAAGEVMQKAMKPSGGGGASK